MKAVDRSQLAHSVKALYGSSFDATGYFRRFFDIDFIPPSPDRGAFVDSMPVATGIEAVRRLGLVLASLPDNRPAFALAAVVLPVLRMKDEQLYHSFVSGDIADIDVVDAVFSDGRTKDLRWEPVGHVFEAILILIFQERARQDG